jgi:hypothetical protein
MIKKGRCLEIAFENIIKNPNWLFCYGWIINIDGSKILHAWNESRGYITYKSGLKIVETINLSNNDKQEFVFDFSNVKEIQVMEKEKYYSIYHLSDEKVSKLNLKQLIKIISYSVRNKKGVWDWINHFEF